MANALLKRPRKGQVMISRDGRVLATDYLTVADLAGPSGATAYQFKDSLFQIVGDVDATKVIAFQADTQATGSTLTIDVGAQTASRTLTVPVLTGNRTFAVIDQSQTFTQDQTFRGAGNTQFHMSPGTEGFFSIFKVENASSARVLEFLYCGSSSGGAYGMPSSAVGINASNGPLYFSVGDVARAKFSTGGDLGILNTTSASSSITGALVVGDGTTTATNVGIGGGNINAGGTLTIGGDFTIADTKNIVLATSTGTKIGTGTTQKLGFWNATPVAQKAGYGTPTGGALVSSYPGATATLAQTSGTLAQLLLDLKAYGILGA